ncbi:DUF3861 family protein [Rhizobium mongolense]|uniref:DUF3861 family protein n=1 Tax=Rhizobium mongolense TaxID=57676 RepID=UPI0035577A5C
MSDDAGFSAGDDEASVLAVGMKLLGQVVLKHRNELAFADFWPHFESKQRRQDLHVCVIELAGLGVPI